MKNKLPHFHWLKIPRATQPCNVKKKDLGIDHRAMPSVAQVQQRLKVYFGSVIRDQAWNNRSGANQAVNPQVEGDLFKVKV